MENNNKSKLLFVLSVLLAASLACSLFPSGETAAGEENTAGSASSGDCIVGKWAVDNSSMQAYLDISINQDEGMFLVGEVTGEMYLTFGADGVMRMSSENFGMAMSIDTGIQDFAFNMTFSIVAEGSAHYTADGTTLTNTERDYTFAETTLEGMIDFSGEDATIEITINPGLFIVGQVDDDTDEFSSTYECSGDTLKLTGEEFFEVIFIRVE
ncbi:MAG: hypothetical protein IH859_06675 [Chloroflexi bacterium]|nr:hypothetical protein [Chloroflexota bacterium]